MKSADQALIVIAALIFTGFGVWFLIKPTALQGIGIEATSVSVFAAQVGESGRVQYGRDIQPILAQACFNCHGPDAAQREARLRLDEREGATAERRHGPAIVIGRHHHRPPAGHNAVEIEQALHCAPQHHAGQVVIVK